MSLNKIKEFLAVTAELSLGHIVMMGGFVMMLFGGIPACTAPSTGWIFKICLLLLLVGVVTFVIGGVVRYREGRTKKVPDEYQIKEGDILYNAKCDVFHKTTVRTYTQHAENLADLNKVSEIFTLCTFEPVEICKILMDYKNASLKGDNKDEIEMEDLLSFSEKEFKQLSNSYFSHFKKFRDLDVTYKLINNKKSDEGIVYRFLLLRPEYYKRNSIEMFEKFRMLNGDIDCRVLKKVNCLKDWTYLTDYVFFNDEFILDYYGDSETIILTYDKEVGKERDGLMKLRNDFLKDKDNYERFPKLTDDYITSLDLKTYKEMRGKYG